MPWNYRIVKRFDETSAETYYALHEVHYDKPDGKPTKMTTNPISFVSSEEEGSDGIIKSLEMALDSVKKRPVLDDPWPDSQDDR